MFVQNYLLSEMHFWDVMMIEEYFFSVTAYSFVIVKNVILELGECMLCPI